MNVHAVKQGYRAEHGIGLFIDEYPKYSGDKGKTVTQLIWAEAEPHALNEPAPIQLSQEAAQNLMDAFWDCGLRPTEGSGSAGSFAAQGRHLADMRKLVFRRSRK